MAANVRAGMNGKNDKSSVRNMRTKIPANINKIMGPRSRSDVGYTVKLRLVTIDKMEGTKI
jgi:hypothetical protein